MTPVPSRMSHTLAGLLRVLMVSALVAAPGAIASGSALAQESRGDRQPMDQEKLVIHTGQGEFAFTVEVADDSDERARGLMFRETMAPDRGMLFVFGQTRPVSMWMKNTPLSLDMVFVLPDGTVSSVAERTTPHSEAVIASTEPVSHVLELRAGVARMIGLKPGDRLVSPSLGE